MDLLLLVVFITICCITGKTIEKRHYKNIRNREILLIKKPYITCGKQYTTKKKVQKAEIIASSIVIGCDRFSTICANLKNIFGGNVPAFETVLDRGRREVLLRVREKAAQSGADLLINVRYESVNLNPIEYSSNPMVSITAYGTAIKYAK